MPLLVQLCIVVVTLAFVAAITMTILAMVRLGESAARLTAAAQVSMTQVERIVIEIQSLLATAGNTVTPAQRVIGRFQSLGERAIDLSAAVFDEIETPALTALAVTRSVHAATSRLLRLVSRRFTVKQPSNNGDHDHE